MKNERPIQLKRNGPTRTLATSRMSRRKHTTDYLKYLTRRENKSREKDSVSSAKRRAIWPVPALRKRPTTLQDPVDPQDLADHQAQALVTEEELYWYLEKDQANEVPRMSSR
jgi:hypothetical protein